MDNWYQNKQIELKSPKQYCFCLLYTSLAELRRIETGDNVESELVDTIDLIAAIMGGMKEGVDDN